LHDYSSKEPSPMPRKPLKIEVNGEAWKLIYRSLRRRSLCGLCDYDRKVMTICTSLADLDRLDTEIHEACHALQGFASEEHTAEIATTLARMLWAIGYRLQGEDDGSKNKSP